MVQKSKGGKKSRSVVAGKKKKNEIKHNRKTNYKKKVVKKVECCVCMEEIPNTSDNTITCGKVNHHLCGECKMKCDTCPMCRSHNVQKPKSQVVNLRVVQKNQTQDQKIERILVKGITLSSLGAFRSTEDRDYGNGIYIKIDEDDNGNGIYSHENYDDAFIYRDYKKRWVLDDGYYPGNPYSFGASRTNCKLFGRNIWNLSGNKRWVTTIIHIKKLK